MSESRAQSIVGRTTFAAHDRSYLRWVLTNFDKLGIDKCVIKCTTKRLLTCFVYNERHEAAAILKL